MKASLALQLLAVLASSQTYGAATPRTNASLADAELAAYFKAETARIAEHCLAEVKTLADWQARRDEYRQQLFEMLSLAPLPARGDLHPVVTGRVEGEHCVVENVHFQSSPGLYVTGNLYLPKNSPRPAPTILYLSGHGPVITNGVSYGNKVTYQHHGAWFARHGYVCLVIDTVQLGEILGLHHGTYREGMWWWNSRGYTPAGVEAWNCIRALDYLETRPEVDKTRFGATGRSGGGAYSWWIAALDDRIKVAAPVAGITDLHNHVVDGAVEGHCDCMFTVNTYHWDYAQVAALVAPRPLLIVNTDADSIFPLDGVQRLHAQLRRIYQLHNAGDKLGLVIGPGPHKDTQDLQVPVFRWFNRHLRGEDPLIEVPAAKIFTPQQLKVFKELPADAINTNIHESFVATPQVPAMPKTQEEWNLLRDGWMRELKDKVFRGWPETSDAPTQRQQFSLERDGLALRACNFQSQNHVVLRLYCLLPAKWKEGGPVELRVVGDAEWGAWLGNLHQWFPNLQADILPAHDPASASEAAEQIRVRQILDHLKSSAEAVAILQPRGAGAGALQIGSRAQAQTRRRFMLLGQTLDGMRVWDIRRGYQALRTLPSFTSSPVTLAGNYEAGVNALYASLFEQGIAGVHLAYPQPSHRHGPDYLNVLRVLDLPQALAMAAERCGVEVTIGSHEREPDFPAAVARNLGWEAKRFRVLSVVQ